MSDDVQCMLCSRWFRTLSNHLKGRHKLKASEYQLLFPGALTVSPSLREVLGRNGRTTNVDPSRFQEWGRLGAARSNSRFPCNPTNDQGLQGETKVCLHCNRPFFALGSRSYTSGRKFCSKSCATTFNNTAGKTGPTKGYGKNERLLCQLLQAAFPNTLIKPNDRQVVPPYEVDIHIPSLRVAIEWNGIGHYAPVFGALEFERCTRADVVKAALLLEKGYTLFVVRDEGHADPSFVQTQFEVLKSHFTELLPWMQH